LNFTAVAPVKFVPVNTTEVPTVPLEGLKLAMVGVAPNKLVATRRDKAQIIRWVMGPMGNLARGLVLGNDDIQVKN